MRKNEQLSAHDDGGGTGTRRPVSPRPPGRQRRTIARRAAAGGLAAVLIAACGSSGNSNSSSASGQAGSSGSSSVKGTVLVFAATSLTDAFDKIGAMFKKAHPGVTMKFNYDGSSTLATQIQQGAPADVFASANTANMDIVTKDQLAAGQPQIFAHNKLEIMVGKGNPKDITGVDELADKSIKVVTCAPEVPCGAYSEDIFKKADITVHPVSEETNVGGVVTKVSLGEADAGVVYHTDVLAGGKTVQGVVIPPKQNVIADYPIVTLKDAPNSSASAAFIKYVMGAQGQQVLKSFGFILPSS